MYRVDNVVPGVAEESVVFLAGALGLDLPKILHFLNFC